MGQRRASPSLLDARRFGNLGLSFLLKLASGYWNLFDPTNGFFACSRRVLETIEYDRLASRYFFESSLLIECNIHGLIIRDMPMPTRYAGEISSLGLPRVLVEFPPRLLYGFVRRVWLKYFIFDFNIISVLLATGLPLMLFGAIFGAYHWYVSITTGKLATAGTVMIASLSIILGFQLVLQALVLEVIFLQRGRGGR